mmetsp:Transcript_21286/g.32324  ORF Transcript_21286/g.32324 Transcript_21286/m.32324 type:complete len:369 (+) Transcript_21286:163-1269(+)
MKSTIFLLPSFQLLMTNLAHGFSTLSISKSHRFYRYNNEGSVKIGARIISIRGADTIGSVGDKHTTVSSSSSSSYRRTSRLFSHEDIDIEPYVGPIGSIADMEGGIAVSELALNVLAGPSLVSNERGLFLCIYDDIDDSGSDMLDGDVVGAVEEIIIPQGTPLCGYARGYFASEGIGDKSVGFLFAGDGAEETAVFFNKELVTLGDALWSVYEQRCSEGGSGNSENEMENENCKDLLFGHIVNLDKNTGKVTVKQDDDFTSRIFVPEVDMENRFSATSLGIYANDLAYDPDSNELEYFENSENNNLLQLVWRLARDEKGGSLVPTWPVVIAKKDLRLLNSVPMEVGLQYGYNYWDAVRKEGLSKYISD